MTHAISAQEVKDYLSSHPGVKLLAAVRAIRSSKPHTPGDFMRLANCKKGHSAIYQRQCKECHKWYCTKCQEVSLP